MDTILLIRNIHKVDDGLYRSGQPDRKQFAELEHAGFTEILNLRMSGSDKCKAGNTSLKLHHRRIMAEFITEKDLLKVLRIIKNKKGKMLVHCRRGSDRTGAVIAMYRIVFQNWSKEQAIEDMINGGYGFHSIYINIVRLIKRIDIDRFKQELES